MSHTLTAFNRSEVSLRQREGPDTLALVPDRPSEPGLPLIDGYEILEELGRGGMGIVYKARDKKLKRLVAIKMLLDPEFASAEQRMRFRIEAEAVAQLKHPHIVQVYELGELRYAKSSIPHPYMVLEYVDGPTLYSYRRGHQFSEREAARLMITLARAMQHAHDHGLIHRDLKPANILLGQVDSSPSCETPVPSPLSQSELAKSPGSSAGCLSNPKITDFGLVKAIAFDGDLRRDLTRPEFMVGTPQYMAPEQANPESVALSCSVDIYSLGVIFYELLTGQLPYNDKDVLKMLMEVQTTEPVSPRKLQPRLSADVETVCLKCLEKEPRRRYASAAALADDLSRYLNHEPIHARPLSEWQRISKWVQRYPTVATLVGTLFAVICTALVIIATLWRQADADRAAAIEHSIKADIARDIARNAEQQARGAEQTAVTSAQETQRALYFSKVAQADLLLRQGQVLRAGLMLRDTEEEHQDTSLRNWEWRYLARMCNPMEQTLTASSDYVHSVAFHPNGRWLFNIQGAVFFAGKTPETYPGELHIHEKDDAGKWRHKRVFQWKLPLREMHFVDQGRKILLMNMKNELECYQTEALINGDQAVDGVRLPSGYRWVLAVEAGQLFMWLEGKPTREIKVLDLNQGRFITTLTMPGDVEQVAVDDQSKFLIVKSGNNLLSAWDISKNAMCWSKPRKSGEVSICISGDGRQMGYHYYPDGELAWLETDSGRQLMSFKKVPGDHVWMPPKGDRLAVSTPGSDGIESIVFRRHAGGEIDQIPLRLSGHVGGICSRTFSRDGNQMVTTGLDGTVRLWDVSAGTEAGHCLQVYRGHAGTVLCANFHPDNDIVASGGIDANVILWSKSKHIVRDRCNLHDDFSGEWVSGYRFIGDSNVLAYFDQKHGRILHMDLDTRKIVQRNALPDVSTEFQVPRYDSDFSSDGKLFAVVDKTLQKALMFDVVTGKPLWSPPSAGFRINSIQFSGNGQRLLVAGMVLKPDAKPMRPAPFRSRYQVWDVPTQQLVVDSELQQTTTSWTINHEGTRVAATHITPQRKYELSVYQVEKLGTPLYTVPVAFPWCFSLQFSRNGRYLAGVNFDSADFKMMMRDAETGKELWLRNTVPETVDVTFTPDSERVLTTSYDSNIIIHDVRSGQDVLTLKHHGTPRMNDYALSPKVVFSNDGRKLVVHHWDCGLTIWHAYGKDEKVELTIPVKRAAILDAP